MICIHTDLPETSVKMLERIAEIIPRLTENDKARLEGFFAGVSTLDDLAKQKQEG